MILYHGTNLKSAQLIYKNQTADINVLKIANDLRASNKMLQSIEEIWNRNFPLQYALHTEFAIKLIRNITYTST